MKIFVDTANVDEIRKANSWGIVDGVTTNPSLVAKEGRDFKEVVREICNIVNGPISAEAVSLNSGEIIEEARELSKIHKNIVVKVPLTAEGLKAIKELSKEEIKTNATLVFSVSQALLAAKAGASYVSPFVGRLDDINHSGMELVKEIKEVFKNYNFKTEIIVASVRHLGHVKEAALLGADIATIPFKVILQMMEHPLTAQGIAQFLEDYEKIPKKE